MTSAADAGIAVTLFPNIEELETEAKDWQPKEFAEQYADRLAHFKERGLLAAQAPFWKLEATCRGIFAEAAMAPEVV